MSDAALKNKKIFISYSWTNEEHKEWVASLGERLMADGVITILDQWDLKDGQDLFHFMEQMVNDPSIDRVLIISDAKYATKADDRKGGVGTETYIISQEVYDSIEQTKFVPILRERDDNGKPCLPTYLKSRKYIDFTNPDNDAEAYDQLLRNILERPSKKKPALGKVPAYILDDEAIAISSAQKAKRFCEFVLTGKGNAIAAFDDFADEYIANLEDLRITFSGEGSAQWCENIKNNIAKTILHRDIFVDVAKAGISLPQDQFTQLLPVFLERLLTLQNKQTPDGSFSALSVDNYIALSYELFLYTFSLLIKARKFQDARLLIDYTYVSRHSIYTSSLENNDFCIFNDYARTLESTCAGQGNSKLRSVTAKIVHDRANNKHVKFSDLLQSDILLCLSSDYLNWYPKCLHYGANVGKLEMFVRATSQIGFLPLKTILKLKSPQELLQKLTSDELSKLFDSEPFFRITRIHDTCNLIGLKSAWGN